MYAVPLGQMDSFFFFGFFFLPYHHFLMFARADLKMAYRCEITEVGLTDMKHHEVLPVQIRKGFGASYSSFIRHLL